MTNCICDICTKHENKELSINQSTEIHIQDKAKIQFWE